MTAETQTLGKVVGANVRRLRQAQDATLEDLSHAARALGVEWSVSRITALQRGGSEPRLGTLATLARILNATVADLVQTDAEFVDLGSVAVRSADLASMFANTPAPAMFSPHDDLTDTDWARQSGYESTQQMSETLGQSVDVLRSMARRSGLVEQRTAAMLDLDADVLSALSAELWGRTLGEERDRLAQEQGRVPADVTAELRDRLRERISSWPRSKRRPTEYAD